MVERKAHRPRSILSAEHVSVRGHVTVCSEHKIDSHVRVGDVEEELVGHAVVCHYQVVVAVAVDVSPSSAVGGLDALDEPARSDCVPVAHHSVLIDTVLGKLVHLR